MHTNQVIVASESNLPVALMEDKDKYSMVVNIFSLQKPQIFIDVDNKKHEVGIYAGKSTAEKKSASFWIFGVPKDGLLEKMKIMYKGGGLQITVPRMAWT
jgi:hypothetical protein